MKIQDSTLKSKILLFGEYSLIYNSMALSIPFENFGGNFTYEPSVLNEKDASSSNAHLKKYAKHLKKIVKDGTLPCKLDIEALEKDIASGIVFDSSIPQGFGLGSSGALIAGIYEKYAIDKIERKTPMDDDDLKQLKLIFSTMENYFHGSSSGLDPLICYIKQPVLVKGKEEISSVDMPAMKTTGKGAIFLINTGKAGKTGPLVELFLEKCKEKTFIRRIKNDMTRYNDNCIKAFLKGEMREMFFNLKELSSFLLGYFSPMIPKQFVEAWEKGLQSGNYYLKLCGSGGGGFILGFTENIEKAQEELKDYKTEVIHRF